MLDLEKGVMRKFSIDLVQNFIEDSDPEFAYGNMVFLSTKPNSHHLDISEKVLRRDAHTILGKWVVCRVNPYTRDAEGHSPMEVIVGQVPKDQEIKFSYDEDGYLLASADFVLSKLYAVDTYNLFKDSNFRNVSVEMLIDGTEMADGKIDENLISRLGICAVTILGKKINGSCPSANAKLVQFEEKKALEFYKNHHNDLSNDLEFLRKFAEERRIGMADKTYKVDKSKDAMSDTLWGDVDKTDLRNKIMDASNKASLVKDVYMVVEDGWEEAPSEKLKYPVMQFKGDTLVYNKGGLSSALGYAKAENDSAVVSKVEKIRKELDIDDKEDNKEGKERKMGITTFEIEGREAWGEIIKKVQSHEGKGVYVDSVEKDHIIFTKDDERYRVDADVKVGKDDKTVDAEIHWGTKKKDKVQKMQKKKMDDDEDDDDEDDHDDHHEDDEDVEKHEKKMRKCCEFIKQLSSDANVDSAAYETMLIDEARRNKRLVNRLAEKDHIIMEKDRQLEELKKFKEDKDKEAVEMEVAKTMEEVKSFVDKESFESLKAEGLACKMESISGWQNKAKSIAFEASKGKSQTQKFSGGIWRMGAPVETQRKAGLWED